jgi:hypothetical protein
MNPINVTCYGFFNDILFGGKNNIWTNVGPQYMSIWVHQTSPCLTSFDKTEIDEIYIFQNGHHLGSSNCQICGQKVLVIIMQFYFYTNQISTLVNWYVHRFHLRKT